MTRVQSTWARGASAIGVPGCPELAFCTASMARARMTLMPAGSTSPRPVRASSAAAATVTLLCDLDCDLAFRIRGEPRSPPAGCRAQTRRFPARPSLLEQGEAGGEAVDVIVPADRTELTGTERACDRHGAEQL